MDDKKNFRISEEMKENVVNGILHEKELLWQHPFFRVHQKMKEMVVIGYYCIEENN